MKDEYVNDECNPERWHQAIRAEMIARSDEYAEAFAEEWQAEEPYLRLKATQRRKSHDKAAYLAAKERYERAVAHSQQVIWKTGGLQHEAEMIVFKQRQDARPKLTDPTYFVTWLRNHFSVYFIARKCPARVSNAPIWKRSIREQFERRYLLFATLHRVFMADGVEAAMKLYQEEMAQKLNNSLWDTSETIKVKGSSARRHEKFDGGHYETSFQADLPPWISAKPITSVALKIIEVDANPNFYEYD